MAGRAVKRAVEKAVRKVTEKLGRGSKETGPPSHAALVAEFMAAKRVQPEGRAKKGGHGLCVFAGPRSWTIDAWVRRTSQIADVPMDWGFSMGRAFVDYFGGEENYKRVIMALKITGPAFEEAAAALARLHAIDPKTESAYEVQWLGSKPWESIEVPID